MDYNNLKKGDKVNNKYEIEKKIGDGERSIIYVAKDNDTKVILKCLNLQKLKHDKENIKTYFKNDYDMNDRISHINCVVKMIECFEYNETFWIAMEYINGKTLADWIKDNTEKRDIEKAIKLIEKISMCLSQIHKETIHRDINPDNIIICEENNNIKFIDFEFSDVKGEKPGNLARLGGQYTAPELKEIGTSPDDSIRKDPRIDIYSVGVIAYEMLTGNKLEGTKVRDSKISSEMLYVLSKATKDAYQERYSNIFDFWGELEASYKKETLQNHEQQFFVEIFDNIFSSIREPLLVLDPDLKVLKANHSFYRMFKVNPDKTEGELIYSLGNGQWNIPKLRELLEDILSENSEFNDFEVENNFETIGRKIMHLNARRIYKESSQTQLILLAIEDVTYREDHKRNLEEIVKKRTVELLAAKEEAEKDKKIAETVLSEIILLKDQLEAEKAYLKEEIKLEYNYDKIVGKSDGLKYVLYKVEQIAASDTTVLVLGETGTGKSLSLGLFTT